MNATDPLFGDDISAEETANYSPERVAYARDPSNSIHLRVAAGSTHTCLSDAEFDELIRAGDVRSLACFARSPHMWPHHLMFIEQLLKFCFTGDEALPSAYEASIARLKSIELHGASPQTDCFRAAMQDWNESGGNLRSDRLGDLWVRYLVRIRAFSALDSHRPVWSSSCPTPASLQAARDIH